MLMRPDINVTGADLFPVLQMQEINPIADELLLITRDGPGREDVVLGKWSGNRPEAQTSVKNARGLTVSKIVALVAGIRRIRGFPRSTRARSIIQGQRAVIGTGAGTFQDAVTGESRVTRVERVG